MQAQPNILIHLFPLFFVFLIFYFLLVRPQIKERKRHEQMIASLKKNDKVVTIGGIHGIVVNIKEKTVVLRIDEGVRIEVEKNCISHKLP